MSSQIDGQIFELERQALSPHVQIEGSFSPSERAKNQRKRRDGPYRGLSRALKYKKLRRTQAPQINVDIPAEFYSVVGERALQFISECFDWVKEICPLNVTKWKDMPEDVLDRLYRKIKGKYELPSGEHVERAINIQCKNLYRKWRERLKKKYFTSSKNIRDAERACPPGINVDQWKWLVNYWNHHKQKERSEKNRINVMSMKIHSACGAKSTARNIYEIDTQINTTEASSSISAPHTQDNSEPKYIQLWNKTKRFGTTISQMQTEIEQLRGRELEMKAEMEQLRANAKKKEEEALEREDKIRAEFKAEMAKVQDFMDHFLS